MQETLGAIRLSTGECAFTVWAPRCKTVAVEFGGKRTVSLQRAPHGYFKGIVGDVPNGERYQLLLDGEKRRPDPASRWQPDGVHGPSAIVNSDFQWTDQRWFGLPLRDYVIYELHVGTFTLDGTFDGVIPHLRSLKDLGITAIEVMPVAQFPGNRNWGYDGVGLFAAQNSYGGPEGLKRLVNAAHEEGLAVILDVVYNHLGPEGNYLNDFGPYFTDAYSTFWGPAFNFDQAESDHVRRYFLENALYWQTECHIDALRLDAVHAINDHSAIPFLQELAATCARRSEAINRRFHLIAESDLNDPKFIRPAAMSGYALDAQWSDDFHHAVHVLLTGEQTGYYSDFKGLRQLRKILLNGYAYTGERSEHRRRPHGAPAAGTHAKQFVVFTQNHDQIGNRMLGERLSALVDFEKLKVAAGILALSPFIPLLFMGEEYGELNPFLYFISHTDKELIAAVREGRKKEFEAFNATGVAPDPQDTETFQQSILQHQLAERQPHRTLRELYHQLFQLRRNIAAIRDADKETIEVEVDEQHQTLSIFYTNDRAAAVIFNFSNSGAPISTRAQPLKLLLDSASAQWGGSGESGELVSPWSFKLFAQQD